MALFDTLKVARELQKTFEAAQAEAIVRALTEVGDDTLATKSDLAQFRGEVSIEFAELRKEIGDVCKDLTSQIGEVRKDLTSQIGEARNDVASVRNELALFKVDTAKWIVGAIAFNLLGTLGIMLTLIRLVAK